MKKVDLNSYNGLIYVIGGLPFIFTLAFYLTTSNDLIGIELPYLFYVFVFSVPWSLFVGLFWYLFVALPLVFMSNKITLSNQKVVLISIVISFVWFVLLSFCYWHVSKDNIIQSYTVIISSLICSVITGLIGGFGLTTPNKSLNQDATSVAPIS